MYSECKLDGTCIFSFSGPARRPLQNVIDQLKTTNKTLKLGQMLCRSRSPDFLLEIIQRQVIKDARSVHWVCVTLHEGLKGVTVNRFTSFSRVLPTSHVVYWALKPIEIVVYSLRTRYLCFHQYKYYDSLTARIGHSLQLHVLSGWQFKQCVVTVVESRALLFQGCPLRELPLCSR